MAVGVSLWCHSWMITDNSWPCQRFVFFLPFLFVSFIDDFTNSSRGRTQRGICSIYCGSNVARLGKIPTNLHFYKEMHFLNSSSAWRHSVENLQLIYDWGVDKRTPIPLHPPFLPTGRGQWPRLVFLKLSQTVSLSPPKMLRAHDMDKWTHAHAHAHARAHTHFTLPLSRPLLH